MKKISFIRAALVAAALVPMMGSAPVIAQSRPGPAAGPKPTAAASPASRPAAQRSQPVSRPAKPTEKVKPSASAEFDRRAAPGSAPRAKPAKLPYRAIPSKDLQQRAKPGLMMRDIKRLNGERNRVTIKRSDGRRTHIDVDARRPSGRAHYDKQTGAKISLPHKQTDRVVQDINPKTGKSFPRVTEQRTSAASIRDMRTARRFLERQNRSAPRPETRPRPRPRARP